MRIKSILFIVFGCILALGFSVFLDRAIGWVLQDRLYFTAMMPNTTEIYDTSEYYSVATMSAQGLRNELVSIPKPADTYRILALGDSFTFGMGVSGEEAWPKLLEQKLHIPGKRVEVINAGMTTGTLHDDALICSAYQDIFDVDAVIVGLYTDDLYQAYEHERIGRSLVERLWPTFSRIGERVIGISRFPEGKPGDTVTSSKSWKLRVTESIKTDPQFLLKIHPDLRDAFLSGKISPALFGFAVTNPVYLTFMLEDVMRRAAIQGVSYDVEMIRKCIGKKRGILLYIPSSEYISSLYAPYKEKLGFRTDDRLLTFDMDYLLAPIAKENGFTYVSALPAFRKDGCTDCYFPYDGHLTPIGHMRLLDVIETRFFEK